MPRSFLNSGAGLLKRRKGRCRIIAVAGVSSGVGTTHSVLMMANYLRRQRLKVGVAELGEKRHFEQVEKAYEGMGFDPSLTEHFRIKQVTYHKCVGKDNLMALYRMDYDVLLLDMGHRLNAYADDFQMADLSVIVAQLSEWKLEEISTFVIAWDQLLDKRTRWLLPFAAAADAREFDKRYSQRGLPIGFSRDPFVRDKVVDRQFQKLFEQ